MINATVLVTVILVALTLLIGVSILIYQHYRYRRKSIDWGDISRYDTPLELVPPGSSNSSFRSYKYSQLLNNNSKLEMGSNNGRKMSNSHLYPTQRPSLSLSGSNSSNNYNNYNKDSSRTRTGGTRSSTRSCPPGVYTTTKQVRIFVALVSFFSNDALGSLLLKMKEEKVAFFF
jgi:hypothetical protein